MRICLISHGSGRGGAEEVLLETVECLRERDIECCVLMPGDAGMGQDLKKLGVTYWSLPYWPWMGNKSVWKRVQMVARNLLLAVLAVIRLRQWKPDIIYSNTMTVCFGAILAALLRRPHVWHLHELAYGGHAPKFDLGPKFSYRIINSASVCIAVSEITARTFADHVDPSKLHVVYQSMHRFRAKGIHAGNQVVPCKKHKLRCVVVGNLSEGKRQEDAIGAIGELKRAGVDAELLIIGRSDAGYGERLKTLVQQQELGDRVSLIGPVFDPMPMVQSADVVLMCSRGESFGRVTVEGMLAGKPVVAADSGASPELIQDGVNGLLFRMGDPKDLAEKIRYLYDHADFALRMARTAQSWAESRFTKQRYGEEVISILTSLAKRDNGTLAMGRQSGSFDHSRTRSL